MLIMHNFLNAQIVNDTAHIHCGRRIQCNWYERIINRKLVLGKIQYLRTHFHTNLNLIVLVKSDCYSSCHIYGQFVFILAL